MGKGMQKWPCFKDGRRTLCKYLTVSSLSKPNGTEKWNKIKFDILEIFQNLTIRTMTPNNVVFEFVVSNIHRLIYEGPPPILGKDAQSNNQCVI